MAITAKFEADFTQFLTETQKATTSLNTLTGMAGKVASAIGIGFSIGAVVNFGRVLLNDADAMVKLSDKTGLSIGALNELKNVAITSGSSLDGMTSAINILQRNLGNDDSGAVGAVRALGLNFDNLKQMSPEDQWFTVARALREVTNQAEFVALGSKLMGRGFMDSIPAIKEGFGEIDKDAERAIRDLDRAGDALDTFIKKAKDFATLGFGGALLGMKGRADELSASLYFMTGGLVGSSGQAEVLASIQGKLSPAIKNTSGSMKDLTLNTTEQSNIEGVLNEQLKDQQAEMKKVEQEQAKLAESITAHWNDVGQILDRVLGVDTLKAANDWVDAIDLLGGSVKNLSNKELADLHASMLEALDVMARNGTLTDDLANKYGALLVATTPLVIGIEEGARGLSEWWTEQDKVNAAVERVPSLMSAATAAVNAYTFSLAMGAIAQSDLLRPQSNLRSDTQSAIMAGPRLSTANTVFNPGNSAGVPVFAEGGPTGAGGLARLHEGEYVVPKNGMLVSGGGPSITNIFNIVDTESNLTRRISDNITRSLKSSLPLRSA